MFGSGSPGGRKIADQLLPGVRERRTVHRERRVVFYQTAAACSWCAAMTISNGVCPNWGGIGTPPDTSRGIAVEVSRIDGAHRPAGNGVERDLGQRPLFRQRDFHAGQHAANAVHVG